MIIPQTCPVYLDSRIGVEDSMLVSCFTYKPLLIVKLADDMSISTNKRLGFLVYKLVSSLVPIGIVEYRFGARPPLAWWSFNLQGLEVIKPCTDLFLV